MPRPWAGHPQGEVPEGHYTVPIGKASVVREGRALSVITYGTMVHVCIAAAEALGLDAEVVDVRSMVPLDIDTLAGSVSKTGRCLIVHEATLFGGFGAELAASIQERCFWHLEAPIARVAGWDTPYPHAFEWEYFPGKGRVMRALQRLMAVTA
jgi:2-oxoisovalerate dehydrogenase E1 component beta subunit